MKKLILKFIQKLIASNIYSIFFYKKLIFFFFKKNKFIYNLLYRLKPVEEIFISSKNRYIWDEFKGFKYIYDLSQVSCNWHFFGINLKHDVYRSIHDNLINSRIVFDIGSNFGFFSLETLSLNSKCKIYAFEPNLKNFEYTKKNILKNNISNIKQYNLGFYSSSRELYENNPNPINSGMINYKENKEFGENINRSKFITGDEFIKKENLYHENIDVIKIDVEGSEYNVLIGMKQYLTKANSILHIEIDHENLKKYNASFEKILILLKECGYNFFKKLNQNMYHYDMICKKIKEPN